MLILMADNRNPIQPDQYSASYYSIASVVNSEYARKHGYDFRYFLTSKSLEDGTNFSACQKAELSSREAFFQQVEYYLDVIFMNLRSLIIQNQNTLSKKPYWLDELYFRLRRRISSKLAFEKFETKDKFQNNCVHHILGPRVAAWSKIPAIYYAMQENYERIVYIDSDAIFNRFDMSIDDFLHNSSSNLGAIEKNALILTYNYPWTNRSANSGFMIWKNNDCAQKFLQTWWDTDGGKYHSEHDYEQYSLNCNLLADNSEFLNDIAILPIITFLERKKQFIRHVGSSHDRLRVPRFRQALAKQNISPKQFRLICERIKENHLCYLDTTKDMLNLTNRCT